MLHALGRFFGRTKLKRDCHHRTACGLTAGLWLLCLAPLSMAADIQLKPQARVDRPRVVLADIAEIYAETSEEEQRLGAVELFAAPAGSRQTVSHQQVSAALKAHGINVAEHRFRGASQVRLESAAGKAATPAVRYTPTQVRQANDKVSAAIKQHLRDKVSSGEHWIVEPQLSEQHLEALAGARSVRVVSAGEEPRETADWLGLQRFELEVASARGIQTVLAPTVVKLPPQVVVVTEGLARGTIIRAQHLKLQQALSGKAVSGVRSFGRIEDAVGYEVMRPISAGEVLDETLLRLPLLVKKGDRVTVTVHCEGIHLRQEGTAQQDGAKGELISIESATNKKKSYSARVSGPGAVEIFLQTPSLASGEEPRSARD